MGLLDHLSPSGLLDRNATDLSTQDKWLLRLEY